MSILTVSERIAVPAPPQEVWAYVTQPPLVVSCLPGATLESSSEDGRTHAGSVLLKLGAFSLTYRGEAEFVQVDHAARRLEVKGKGREKAGTGNVAMTIVVQVHPAEGGSEVQVDANMQLAGKIVSFGRGMSDAVAEQVMGSFARCLSTSVVSGEGESKAPDGEPGGGPDASGAGGGAETPAAEADGSGTDGIGGLGLLFRAFLVWVGRILGVGRR